MKKGMFRYGKIMVNLDSISYSVIEDDDPNDIKVNIVFIGDGTYSDWGLTLEGDEAKAFIKYIDGERCCNG